MREKIYYCSLQLETGISIKIVSVFGIPFYCLDESNPVYPGTWLPFLGLEELTNDTRQRILKIKNRNDYNLILLQILKKPKYTHDIFLESLQFGIEPNKKIILNNLINIKCMLISIALGGGIWEIPSIGNSLYEYIKKNYKIFFDSNIFEVTNSKIVINPSSAGVSVYSDIFYKYIDQVNNLLGFTKQNSTIIENRLSDVQILIKEGSKASTLLVGQMGIDSVFAKKYPRIEMLTQEYTLHVPNYNYMSDQDKIFSQNVFDFITEKYPTLIEHFKFGNVPTEIYEKHGHVIVFLSNGHVLGHEKNPYFFKNTSLSKVFKGYLYTGGKDVVIKSSNMGRNDVLAGSIFAGKRGFVQPTIGYYNDHRSGFISVVSDLYTCDLYEMLIEPKRYILSFDAVEKIFISLLRGLANLHDTSILYDAKIQGRLFHSDIKSKNVFVALKDVVDVIDAKNIEVVFGDLDSAARYTNPYYTIDYVCPARAKMIMENKKIDKDKTYNRYPEDNYMHAKKYDVWSLGITFAELLLVWLQIKRHDFNPVPYMNFMYDNIDQGKTSISLSDIANIQQVNIDNEIREIKAIVDQKIDSAIQKAKLCLMWDTINLMLQVNPDARQNIFDLSNDFRKKLILCEHKKVKQSLITDYFPIVRNNSISKSPSEVLMKQACSLSINDVKEQSKCLTQKSLFCFGFTRIKLEKDETKDNIKEHETFSMSL